MHALDSSQPEGHGLQHPREAPLGGRRPVSGQLRAAPALSGDELAELKRVAREMLAKLKELLVLNWRQKSTARSQLRLAIEDALDSGLPPVYSRELYEQKCSAVFEHFYESYPERNAGIYSAMA